MSLAALTDTQGVIAIAAVALAAVATICCAVLALTLRRAMRAQRIVMGDGDVRNLVEHAAEVQRAFESLRDYVELSAEHIDARVGAIEDALPQTISLRSLVRYDAYNEMSGRQSMSIALLDESRSGIVLSSIRHRDQARLYAKVVRDGRGELELSPEEDEAVRLASTRPATAHDGAHGLPPAAR